MLRTKIEGKQCRDDGDNEPKIATMMMIVVALPLNRCEPIARGGLAQRILSLHSPSSTFFSTKVHQIPEAGLV